jgi:23S rRNA pseudouridine2457 synthase
VQVDGIITLEAINLLKKGIVITVDGENYTTKPCKVTIIQKDLTSLPVRSKKIRDERHGPTSWISITLREGKFRQVRKMTAAANFPTLRLIRARIGNIYLNNMQAGEIIELDENFEV